CMKIELKRIRDHWTDFCNVTSVHGVRYLAASDRPLVERLWWASVLTTCLYYATVYATALCKRWLDSPIEHTSVIKYENVLHIPLPAVTFCNNMKSISVENSETLLFFLCGLADTVENNDTIFEIEKMLEMAPPFNSTCKLHNLQLERNFYTDCAKMFTRVITQNGVCYSFNMMDTKEIFREGVISNYQSHSRRSDWDPDTGYKEDAPLMDSTGSRDPFNDGPYPKRSNGNPVINISFGSLFNGSYCRNGGPGFQVAVHSPHEMPVIGHRTAGWVLVNDVNNLPKERSYSNLRFDYEYVIELDPERTWASDSLRIFQPHQRKCYFNGEKTLTFFKYYTRINCENECLINRTIVNCKCFDFYMPHFESSRICHKQADVECLFETMGNVICGIHKIPQIYYIGSERAVRSRQMHENYYSYEDKRYKLALKLYHKI
ncbi:pickpocket protein 28, partial [Halyomorpha halys]|uniref:pickpocket protein 28 n=1 Tax=Halyomorpha halys TaxID=286706 RepID=UPI0034D38FB3